MKKFSHVAALALALLSSAATAAPVLEITPVNLIFPDTVVTAGASTAVVQLKNTGTESVTFPSAPELTGSSVYTFAEPPVVSDLAPGSSRTILLQFDPIVDGFRSATLKIRSNDHVSLEKSITLWGTGLAPQVAFYKTSLDFGQKVTTEPGSHVLDVYIDNTGSLPLNFIGLGVSLEGPDAADFQLASVTSLAPLETPYPP